MVEIERVRDPKEFEIVSRLFLEYAQELEFVLKLDGVDRDFADLSHVYGPPDGCLLLARTNAVPAGCLGLMKVDESCCELRRLYVRKEFRKQGIGRLLMISAIEQAGEIGYRKARLDTTTSQREAISLCSSLGFTKTPAYVRDADRDAVFMELLL